MRTYKARGIVLRKVKLGEKDLIVTLLEESGALIRAVAKGARRPGGSLAAKLELFSVVDAMFAKGRSLDVITEARFSKDAALNRYGIEQASCASAIAELLCNVAQEDLEHPKLFEMTHVAFDAIAQAGNDEALAITAAALLKVLASAGFRPSLDTCISCGSTVEAGDSGQWVSVSFEDGGVVCENCSRPSDCIPIEASTIAWAKALIYMRFADLAETDVGASASFSVLRFARQWARVHTGRDLKSLDFIFTCGLF